MSRSGYSDDCDDNWSLICYRGALASAMRGKRGQAFLKELLAALDAMPSKRLITNHLEIDGDQDSYTGSPYGGLTYPQLIVGADELVAKDGTVAAMGEVCALGALGKVRGLDMSKLDPDDAEGVAAAFGVNDKIIREIVYSNDEIFADEWVPGKDGRGGSHRTLTPEERWQKMRDWVASQIWEWREVDDTATPQNSEASDAG